MNPSPFVAPDSVAYSKDSLDAPIDYDAADSIILDIKQEQVHLFGDAVVTHKTLKITADYIIFDWGKNIVTAQGTPDSTGQISGYPVFEDTDQRFNAKKVRYNFKTKKGIIYDATTQEQDIYVLGKRAAFLGEDATESRETDIVYSRDAIFTTCNHPQPHFGIRSRKQKVIPNKVVVVGGSNVEIGGVPTPLWLPFGFFPLKQGRRTGLIFPRNYEYSAEWGFGLRGIGWYFPLNDYWDLTAQGDIYTRGTWGLNLTSNYRRRYKYNGRLQLQFADRKQDVRGVRTSNRSYSIVWNHSQDAKAHPTNQFSGSVNIQTNNYQSTVNNDFESVFQNSLSSTVSFSKRFPGKPITFNAAMRHSQNTRTRKVDVSLPTVNFQLNRIFPFKRKRTSGSGDKERWYEKISLQYRANLQNRFTATDTTLFTQQTLDDAQFGLQQEVNSNASFRVFKHFNLTPSVNYEEVWYFKTTEKFLDPTLTIDTTFEISDGGDSIAVFDTVGYGTVTDLQNFGFSPMRLFSTGVSLNTQIFGIRTFRKGFIRGIRHVIKPSINFNYTPDYTMGFGYFKTVDTDIRDEENNPLTYSIFEGGIYGEPPSSGRQMALTFRLNNIFEGKYWSKRDSTAKVFKFFDNVYVDGGYNFAADSLKWRAFGISGTTRIFKGLTTVNFGAQYDVYATNEDGRRINTFYRQTNGKLLRYEGANLRFATRISVRQIRDLFNGSEPTTSGPPQTNNNNRQAQRSRGSVPIGEENILDLLDNFQISHQFNLVSTPDSFFVQAHTIDLSGRIKLTKNWNLDIGRISYNFKVKQLIYPSLGFYRDLHCWEMGMNWAPARSFFSFFLRVKPGSLDFIKVPYGRNNVDGGFQGF